MADQFCERLVAVAQDACTGGLNTAASVSPAVAALAVVIAVTGLRHLRTTGQPPGEPAGAGGVGHTTSR
ncbi:hypothetical protein ACQBAT_01885 [Ornithinimicrobium sp. Y1847]|uniref:hypothetical protein n=1 Tax=Ornithinimicrobium sp. Y1847 TaxID=3405419 RepID=UPI003B681827